MNDNTLKIIKDELERIETDYLEDRDNARHCINLLTKALSIAVTALEFVTTDTVTTISGGVTKVRKAVNAEISDEALKSIASILSGGKDGK